MSNTLISLNPFANEPKADKAFEVTETVYPFRTKRVEANTAYYAAQKAFPAARFEHLTFRFIGRVIDAAVEAQKAETVRPPADEFDTAYDEMIECLQTGACDRPDGDDGRDKDRDSDENLPGYSGGRLEENGVSPNVTSDYRSAYPSDTVLKLQALSTYGKLDWLAKEQRQRDMAIRVASRLRRELAVEVTDPATWVCLRQWSDELAGDQ